MALSNRDQRLHRRASSPSCPRVPPDRIAAAADPSAPAASPDPEATWIEPFPDAWLEGVARGPGAAYELREAVALAFVAALHALTPPQRAVLLLRDVVGLSAIEAASALGLGVEAVNSALFRARSAVQEKTAGRGVSAAIAPSDEALLARYLHSWESGNLDEFVALLHHEVKTTMPPSPTWIAGKPANVTFYRPMFAAHWPGKTRVVPVGANGQPAFAFYRASSPGAPHRLRAIQLVELERGAIASIDHFMIPRLFDVFGLPVELVPGDDAAR